MSVETQAIRSRAEHCTQASVACTKAAAQLQAALDHAAGGRCPPKITAALARAQRDISYAQGEAEVRRRRLLRKADAKEQSHPSD